MPIEMVGGLEHDMYFYLQFYYLYKGIGKQILIDDIFVRIYINYLDNSIYNEGLTYNV